MCDVEVRVSFLGELVEGLDPATLLSFVDVDGLTAHVDGVRAERLKVRAVAANRERRERFARIFERAVALAKWEEEGDLEDEDVQYFHGGEDEFETHYWLDVGMIAEDDTSLSLSFSAYQNVDFGSDKAYFDEDGVVSEFSLNVDGIRPEDACRFLMDLVAEEAECGDRARKLLLSEIEDWAAAAVK